MLSQFSEGILDEYFKINFQEKTFSTNPQEINKTIKCLFTAASKFSFK